LSSLLEIKEKVHSKIDTKFLFSLLEEMIEIDSIIGKEKELAVFLAEKLQELGLAIQLEDVEPNRPNLYAQHTFSNSGKTLTYNGHLDTVEVCGDWTHDPFIPFFSDEKLFGLGSADMKGGMACQIAAIKALLDSGEEIPGMIHFTAVIDEEGYGIGAKKMLDNPMFGKGRTDGVVIAEPLFGDSDKNPLPLGMTGKVLYKIMVKGVSAHAFRPELGVNAVSDASRIVSIVEEISKTGSSFVGNYKIPHDFDFGKSSFCVLKIDGGYKTYSVIVPEHCEIILNRLTLPGETKESVRKDFEQLIADLKLKSKVTIEIIPPYYNSYKISKNHKLYQSLETSYKEILSQTPKTAYLKMITDANTFMGVGEIPTVHFGPKGNNLHGADEHVFIDSLEKTAKVYSSLYLNFQI
jgi:acetylornithine deacetylase/succinyl-diaminopimelate desuccinylase family protein